MPRRHPDCGRALWPRAGGDRRRGVGRPRRAAREQSTPSRPVVLGEGHGGRRSGHPPASLTRSGAGVRARPRAFAAQAVEQHRSSEGWEQWLAARRLSRVRPCQPAADRHTEARGDRGGRLPRMAQVAWTQGFLGSGGPLLLAYRRDHERGLLGLDRDRARRPVAGAKVRGLGHAAPIVQCRRVLWTGTTLPPPPRPRPSRRDRTCRGRAGPRRAARRAPLGRRLPRSATLLPELLAERSPFPPQRRHHDPIACPGITHVG